MNYWATWPPWPETPLPTNCGWKQGWLCGPRISNHPQVTSSECREANIHFARPIHPAFLEHGRNMLEYRPRIPPSAKWAKEGSCCSGYPSTSPWPAMHGRTDGTPKFTNQRRAAPRGPCCANYKCASVSLPYILCML